jgi:uroporphyrinogen decarboxylase
VGSYWPFPRSVKDASLRVLAADSGTAQTLGPYGKLGKPPHRSLPHAVGLKPQMNDRILRAARGQPVDVTPVWLMRQAGRYLPEYRAIRGKVEFLELCKTPDLAAEVTVQPVTRLGVDAAIIFSDILIPVEAMGMELELGDKGPHFPKPLRTAADVERLGVPDPEEATGFVGEAIRRTRRALRDSVPVIGFAGAPFTLAAYMVEGGGSKASSSSSVSSSSSPSLRTRFSRS